MMVAKLSSGYLKNAILLSAVERYHKSFHINKINNKWDVNGIKTKEEEVTYVHKLM